MGKHGCKFVFVLGLASLAAVLLSALAVAEPIRIVQLGYEARGEDWNNYVMARAAEFEKIHPNVTIERIYLGTAGGTAMQDKFTMMVGAGSPPDVTEFTSPVGGNLFAQGVFMDLKPFFNKDNSISLREFAPPAVAALTWSNGVMWGMPTDINAFAAAYNVDLWTQAGLVDPNALSKSEWNWEYALAAAKKLTLDKNGDGATDQWGIDSVERNLLNFAIPIMQAGGSRFNQFIEPTKSNLLDPATIEGYEWIAELFKAGVVAPVQDVRFYMGKSGMSFGAGSTALGSTNEKSNFEWDVASPLMGPKNNGSFVAANTIQMTSYTKHPDIVWEWIKYLVGTPQNLVELTEITSRMPVHMEVVPQYQRIIGDRPKHIGNYIDILSNPDAFSQPMGPGVSESRSLIFSTFIDRVVNKGEAVRTTLQVLDSQVNAILAGND